MAQPALSRPNEPDCSCRAAPAGSHSALGEEVLAVYAYTPATLAGLAAGFGMLLLLFWSPTPLSVLLPWMALFIGLWFVRIALAQAFDAPSGEAAISTGRPGTCAGTC